jgi:predicted transcriptional regulator of viral defense system
MPITLIFTPTFDVEGVIEKELHRFMIRIASPEKVLLDGAAIPNRIGGVFGLARVLDRAGSRIEWGKVVTLATNHPKGRPALRRLAVLIELLSQDVPPELREAASARAGDHLVYLADRRTHGAKGIRQAQWQVVMNVDPLAIQDEVRR